jgi:hypothetical protein
MSEITTVTLSKETRELLESEKIIPRETCEQVILRLLESQKKVSKK